MRERQPGPPMRSVRTGSEHVRRSALGARIAAFGMVILITGANASATLSQELVEEVDSEQVEEPPESTGESPTSIGEAEAEISDEEMQLLLESLGADTEDVSEQSADESSTGPALSGLGNTARAIYQSMNPDISFILDVAAAYYSTDEPLSTGAHDPRKTGFNFQQLELSVSANVDPYFFFATNIVFSQFGVEVEEAYGQTLSLPANLQLRAGQFLYKFGRINPTHPHTWSFLDQVLVIGKFFGPEGNRGLAVELSWLSPLPWFAELVGSIGDATGDCCSRSYYGSNDPGINGMDDFLYNLRLVQFFPFGPSWSLMWGLSAQFGPNPTGQDNRTEIYGTDLYLRYYPVNSSVRSSVSWQTEFMYRTRQVPLDRLQDWGLYSQLVWAINFRWEVGARYEYVSGVEDDYIDPEWSEPRQRVSLAGTFYPSHFSRIRLQGNYDDPKWRDSYWGIMLGLELVTGAHGSHEY